MRDKKIISCPNCDKKVRIPSGKHLTFVCPRCNEKLEFNDKAVIQATKVKELENKNERNFGDDIVSFLIHLIAIPIFIVLHKILPDWEWKFHLDRILLFLGTVLLVEIIFQMMRFFVIIGFVATLAYLGYGSIWGNYGFVSLFKDYKHFVYSLIHSPHPENIIISKLKPFPHKSEILTAIDFDNPDVRNFAIQATRKYFQAYQDDKDYRTIIQCFAIFKEINNNWNYVSDPTSREYFAKASESIKHLSGDCDDHSIIMAACIKAIGGRPRLIYTTGHLYPELLIGSKSDMEAVNYLIKRELFSYETNGKQLHYNIDDYGQIWLNLDYTAEYPGGKFMNKEILGILTLE